jgi:hypothetical protein
MAKYVQHNPKNVNNNLYHHGIILILLVKELRKHNDNWYSFLVRNGFAEAGIKLVDLPYEVTHILERNEININESEYLNSHGAERFTIGTRDKKRKPFPRKDNSPFNIVVPP